MFTVFIYLSLLASASLNWSAMLLFNVSRNFGPLLSAFFNVYEEPVVHDAQAVRAAVICHGLWW